MTTGTPNAEYVRACKKCDNIFVSPFRRAKICGDCHKDRYKGGFSEFCRGQKITIRKLKSIK